MGQIGTQPYPFTGNQDFYHRVAQGMEPDFSSIHIYGQNPNMATAGTQYDICNTGSIYYPTAPVRLEIVSSNANDTLLGSGAKQVYVETLDNNWNTYIQTVNMNGTTAVALAGTHMRFQLMSVMGDQSAIGNITLRVAGGGTTALTIQDGDNVSVSSAYTVPNGHTAYFIQGFASSNSKVSGAMDFKLLTRRYGGVFMIKGRSVCNDTGSSWWVYQYQISSLIPAKTDFKIVATGGANSMTGICGYELLLEKTS